MLLLDEPLSSLDATLRMDMRAELKRLHAETGATVIYVTHDQLEALTMSTHIALMSDGQLQPFVPLAEPLPVPPGEPVVLGLRAEELDLTPIAGDAPSGAPGRARGTISSVLPTGSDWYYRVAYGADDLIVRQNEHPDLRLGDPVWIDAAPAPLKVFGADGRTLTGIAGVAGAAARA